MADEMWTGTTADCEWPPNVEIDKMLETMKSLMPRQRKVEAFLLMSKSVAALKAALPEPEPGMLDCICGIPIYEAHSRQEYRDIFELLKKQKVAIGLIAEELSAAVVERAEKGEGDE